MKKLLFVICLLTAISGSAQSLFTIQPGAQLSIGANASIAFDNLVLTPSSTLTVGSNTLNKTTAIVHPSNNPSIKQAYNVLSNITGFSGTITMYYNDADLNGLDESSLTLNIHDGTKWNAYPSTSVNTTSNFVITSGLNNLSINELTLAAANAALPVNFVRIVANCVNNSTVIVWTTAQEINVSHYDIESSTNGLAWTKIGEVAATGSSSEHNYSFADSRQTGNYYRVVSVDLSGARQLSPVVHAACTVNNLFGVYPNPVRSVLTTVLTTTERGTCTLLLFDHGGKLVRRSVEGVVPGTNYFTISMEGLAAGSYVLRVQQGQQERSTMVIKE